MSRKTKKQKLLADQRRKTQFKEIPKIELSKDPLPQNNVSVPEPVSKKQLDQIGSMYYYPVQLIRKDLTKTLILCILAISFEIALFFIIEKGINLPFKF